MLKFPPLTREEIDDFCARHLMEVSTFGKKAANSGCLYRDLGRNPPRKLRKRTLKNIRDYMAAMDAQLAATTQGGHDIGKE